MVDSVQQTVDRLRDTYDIVAEIMCDDFIGDLAALFFQVKQHQQVEYSSNQQFVFVITSDSYKKNSHCGILLQSLQNILNIVDISNFFVTIVSSNPNIQTEYKWVLENVSSDKVPCNIIQCSGEWNKIPHDPSHLVFDKQVAQSIDSVISTSLTAQQSYRLTNSKSFCLMPWVGTTVAPSGDVRPCCVYFESLGNTKDKKLIDIWSSPRWKKLRSDMLTDQPIKNCSTCYELEALGRHSLRLESNRKFSNKIKDIEESTLDDGTYSNFAPLHWDIRHNNLCNLVCRGCHPGASSSWYQPAKDLGIKTKERPFIKIDTVNEESIVSQLLEFVDDVETIYFAGGEPLIISDFYEVLDLLLERNRTDVKLIYNTNLTKLSVQDKNIISYWKKFSNVSIGASLDGEGERGEYLRQNSVWQDIVSNRKLLIQECPHVDFYVSATVSILNALHLPDFHRSWVDQGLLSGSAFNFQLLFTPDYLRLDSAPELLKEQVREKYSQYLEWVMPIDPLGRATLGAESVIDFTNGPRTFDASNFWYHTDKLDQYFNKNLIDTFPELSILPRRPGEFS